MKKDNNSGSQSGFTVAELESRFKKYGLEITLCVTFALAAIFALIWGGAMLTWSILLSMIGAIVGVLIPAIIHKGINTTLRFALKEKTSAIASCVVAVLISILVPFLIFALVGLIAGKASCLNGRNCSCSSSCEEDSHDHKHTGS